MKVEMLIKDVRVKKNVTLKRLSILTGLSTTHLNDIENNKKRPSLYCLILIAKALKVNITELYKINNL